MPTAAPYDHYAEAHGIADRLRTYGRQVEADAIRNAIEEGATGTEIFMRLRYVLAPLRTDKSIDDETARLIAFLINKINGALGR